MEEETEGGWSIVRRGRRGRKSATLDDPAPPTPSTELGARIPALPFDILPLVLAEVARPYGSGFLAGSGLSDIASCCLVSSTFHQAATPVLYRRLCVILPWWESGQLLYDPYRRWVPFMADIATTLASRPKLQQPPRTLAVFARDGDTYVDTDGLDEPSRRLPVLGALKDFLHLLPALESLDLSELEDARLFDSIARALPEMPFRSSLTKLKLETDDLDYRCFHGVEVALQGLKHLRDLEIRDTRFGDTWASSRTDLPQLIQLDISTTSYNAVSSLLTSSASSLRTLSLDLVADHAGDQPSHPPYPLAICTSVEDLGLCNPDLSSFEPCLPQLASLDSLRRLDIGINSHPFPRLGLSTALPKSLLEIGLDSKIHPSDILDLLRDTRFVGCQIRWEGIPRPWMSAEQLRELSEANEAMKERARLWEEQPSALSC